MVFYQRIAYLTILHLQSKGSRYRVSDLLNDSELAKRFKNGICLVFRLEARDYHRYCYIDDCYRHDSHYIEGELHSVQPIALENYPVFALNRRLWNLLETKNFGPIVQTEIGALLVGGFSNNHPNGHFIKVKKWDDLSFMDQQSRF